MVRGRRHRPAAGLAHLPRVFAFSAGSVPVARFQSRAFSSFCATYDTKSQASSCSGLFDETVRPQPESAAKLLFSSVGSGTYSVTAATSGKSAAYSGTTHGPTSPIAQSSVK